MSFQHAHSYGVIKQECIEILDAHIPDAIYDGYREIFREWTQQRKDNWRTQLDKIQNWDRSKIIRVFTRIAERIDFLEPIVRSVIKSMIYIMLPDPVQAQHIYAWVIQEGMVSKANEPWTSLSMDFVHTLYRMVGEDVRHLPHLFDITTKEGKRPKI